jgi:hypothetical protein
VPCDGKHDCEQQRHCREQSTASTQPEAEGRELAKGKLVEQSARHKVARNHKEYIHPGKAAGKTALKVEEDDRDNGDCAQPVHLRTMTKRCGGDIALGR